MFKNYSLNRLLVFLTIIGFFFLLIDSILEHRSIYLQHLPTIIPIAFSAFGLGMGIIAVCTWKEPWIRRLHIFLFASILVAGTGIYFHIEDKEEGGELTVTQQVHEEKEKEKPLLAPLSFAGIAAVGLLGTSRKWQAEVI